MRIVIAGAGEAGVHLAKSLASENFDVVIMDPDPGKLEPLNGYDLLTVAEDPVSIRNLRDAGTAGAEMFISLTPDDTENILLAIMAKGLGARSTAARINRDSVMEPDFVAALRRKGVDHLIYPEMLAVQEVESALRHTWSRHWSGLCDNRLIVAAGMVSPDSRLSGMTLRDFSHLASDFHVSAVTRGRQTIIPKGDTILRNGDIAYISTVADNASEISGLFNCSDCLIKKVMVVGGSRVGEMVARYLSRDYDVLLVEKDARRARKLSESMPAKVMVANGDGRSMEFLEAESISDYDAYIAFTESSEGNIIGCQIAGEMGVENTVVKTTSIDLVAEAEKLGIKTVVNKNLLCSARVRRILLESSESGCMSLAGADITVLVVRENSPVTKKRIMDMKIPGGVTLAGMVRNGVPMIVRGDTRLRAGDRVAVFMLQGTLSTIRNLFR